MAKFTALAQTVLQYAMTTAFEQASIIGDSALHAGEDLEVLKNLLPLFHGCCEIKRARRVVNAPNALSESAGATRTSSLNRHQQWQVPRGFCVQREIRLILECDGNTKCFDHGQTTEQALLEERERENALIEEGWRIIRMKWKQLNIPELLKARIMKAYLAAQRAAA